ncbi:Imm52 family immunity protein [Photorhabdus bodei]|uniref:Imm52 family immunity protein n=1 Tax=Photorhabdus bodei TaxID=2029681 RepID=A0AAW6BJ84_9GAMM|nr:Imm52 family immunity protein [Photorhabdus bodei]MDB6372651.1 Imm52 family immunity protein [Photorhabdus bodei]
MTIVRIDINVRYEKRETITANTVLMDLFNVTQQLNTVFNRKKIWFLTGYSRREALKHIVFDEHGPTKTAMAYFEKSYKKDFPLLVEGIWDGEKDELISSIDYSKIKTDRPNWVWLALNLRIESHHLDFYRLIDLIKYLAVICDSPYIQMETNEYTLQNNHVFPDRLSVGWMLYQPRIIDKSYLSMAEDVLPVYQNNEQIGTLIITQKGIFDGRNQDDIDKSNDVEIQLMNLGLLPLITEV